MFYLAGVGLSFFLTLLLFTKRHKTLADKILAGWLLVVTLHLLTFYFRIQSLYPQTLGIEIPLPILHGPFLLLYVRALTRGELSRYEWLHFAPAVLSFTYLIQFFVLPVHEKLRVYEQQGAGYELFNNITSVANVLSGIVYVALSALALRRHRQSIANQFSNTDKINLNWLQYLIYWIGAIWFFVIFSIDEAVFGTAVLMVIFIGYFGIRQVGIFHAAADKVEPTLAPQLVDETQTTEKKKYEKSGLTPEAAVLLRRQLNDLMEQEKVYCETELSLADLASRLNTQANYLSQVINEQEGTNFYDYINTLRVREFQRLAAMPENKRYTLLALAQQCGFNSKSSFNRYFKKVTGKLPSEFVSNTADAQK